MKTTSAVFKTVIFVLSLMGLVSPAESAHARASMNMAADATMEIEFSFGLGWHLCDAQARRPLPPLDSAFLCSGRDATPVDLRVQLKRTPAAKPEWLLYTGSHTHSQKFDAIVSTVELSISYAKVDGKTYAFIDGRIRSERAGKVIGPIYFRLTGEEGFDRLAPTSVYGAPVFYKSASGHEFEYAPYIRIEP